MTEDLPKKKFVTVSDDAKAIIGCSLLVLFMFISVIVISGLPGAIFVVQIILGLIFVILAMIFLHRK
jgi:hypothetical protein